MALGDRMAAAEADMTRQLEEHARQLESDVADCADGLRREVAALVAQQEGLGGLVARLQEASRQEGALELARVEATKAAVQGLEQQASASALECFYRAPWFGGMTDERMGGQH